MFPLLVAVLLVACSSPTPQERAVKALQAQGMSNITLEGELGVFEFRADRGVELCAGTVNALAGREDVRITRICNDSWGAEELRIPIAASKQGRERAHGCDQGDATACALLGTDYRDGTNGLPGDKARAIALFTGSCDAGAYHGCTYLAGVYDGGTLAPADPQKALDLYQKACELGSTVSCEHLQAAAVP